MEPKQETVDFQEEVDCERIPTLVTRVKIESASNNEYNLFHYQIGIEDNEVKPSDYSERTSDSINIKKEAEDETKLKIEYELLSEEVDLPTLKSEDDYTDQTCSEESQVLVKIKKSDVKEVNKMKRMSPCPVCKKNSGSTMTCSCENSYINNDDGTDEKPFQCKICSKRFTRKRTLIRHIQVHTDETPFKCEICSKRVASNTQLSQHMVVHTGEKPFQCEICSKRFALKANLTRHTVVHTAEKMFQCEICLKRFASKTYLRQHMVVHAAEKPFQCNICSKRFTQKQTLIQHIQVHTDDQKPFQCEICSKRFTFKQNLHQHKVYLATGCSLAELHYNVGRSIDGIIIKEVSEGIWTVLTNELIPQCTTEKWIEIASGFETFGQFPNCIGAIHIRTKQPPNSGSMYYNYKQYFSMVLFAMCDAYYCFTYIDVGSYGKSSDAGIFKRSKLYENYVMVHWEFQHHLLLIPFCYSRR